MNDIIDIMEEMCDVLEGYSIFEERKNNKQKLYMRNDDPEHNKIGVKKYYNRVIHNDSSSKDPYFNYVKIKGTKYRIDKDGAIGAPIDNDSKVFPLKEGMNLGDMVADVIYKKKQEDPDADVEKLEALQKKAEQIPAYKDLHKDEKGNWVKPEGYDYSRVPSNVKGSNATDARRNLSKEAADNLRDERINDMFNDYPKAKANSIKRHKEKLSKKNNASEAFKLIEEAFGLMTSLFEVDDAGTTGDVQDNSKEHNKLKRVIKDEKGQNTDVVSVADELFPYSGNAKEQFNQKVIAKINDMIEGKATLEDLIQLVRKKQVTKKVEESFEGELKEMRGIVRLLEDLLNEREQQKEVAKRVLPTREDAYNKALANFEKVLNGIHTNSIAKQGLTKPEQEELNRADKEVTRTQNRVIQAKEKAGA